MQRGHVATHLPTNVSRATLLRSLRKSDSQFHYPQKSPPSNSISPGPPPLVPWDELSKHHTTKNFITQLQSNPVQDKGLDVTLVHHHVIASLLSCICPFAQTSSAHLASEAALLGGLALVMLTVAKTDRCLRSGLTVRKQSGERQGVYPYVILLVTDKEAGEKLNNQWFWLARELGITLFLALDG